MPNYYKTGVTVTTVQSIINALLAFLTASGPGAAWVQDATYTVAGNPGEMFIATSGATTHYVYFAESTVDTKTVLQCFYVPGASHGYGGGAGPTNHFTGRGCFLYPDSTNYDMVLHMFASEDRCIAVLHSTLKAGVIPAADMPAQSFQVLYFGGYTPHCDAADDTYPLVIAGNGLASVAMPDDVGVDYGFFPESLAKRIGASNLRFTALHTASVVGGSPVRAGGFRCLRESDFVPPKNSRGSEVFVYPQGIFLDVPGNEESIAFTGLYLAHGDVGLEQDVTVGGSTYYSIPSLLNVVPPVTRPHHQQVASAYLIPKGTVVP